MKKASKAILVEMISGYLAKRLKGKISNSMSDDDRNIIEIYLTPKKGGAITIISLHIIDNKKELIIYSIFHQGLRAPLIELFECFGFNIVELKQV